jgi:tRNA(adenine34) deaminase
MSVELIDQEWMRHALALADKASLLDDEIPVAAVIVGPDGELLAEGWNRNISEHDPSAHAEIVALRKAGQKLNNHRLVDCTVYVTLEPCAMCAMAMIHARVKRVVFAANDPKTGAAGSVFKLLQDSRHNHIVEITSGVMADEASQKLSDYFRQKRQKK